MQMFVLLGATISSFATLTVNQAELERQKMHTPPFMWGGAGQNCLKPHILATFWEHLLDSHNVISQCSRHAARRRLCGWPLALGAMMWQ